MTGLLQRAQQGDAGAADELFAESYPLLRRLAAELGEVPVDLEEALVAVEQRHAHRRVEWIEAMPPEGNK